MRCDDCGCKPDAMTHVGPCSGQDHGWCSNDVCTSCSIPDGYCWACQREHHDEIRAEVEETLREIRIKMGRPRDGDEV